MMPLNAFDAQKSDNSWLTIGQAAQSIGASERASRRYLRTEEQRQQAQAGTRREERQTNTGTRSATVLSPAFIDTLRQHFADQNTPAEKTGTQDRQDTGTNAGTRPARMAAQSTMPAFEGDSGALLTPTSDIRLAVVYERLIAAKDEQIQSLTSRLEALEGALQRSQENEARAQTLQAMQPQRGQTQPPQEPATAPIAPEPKAGPALPEPGIWRLLYRLVNYRPK